MMNVVSGLDLPERWQADLPIGNAEPIAVVP
jgi:hypothetical protein